MQQRQWQVQREQQQRVYVQPRQQNWGQIRRQQNFETKQYRNELKAEQRGNRDAFKYERKQQHFEEKAFRKAGRDYQPETRSYTYRQRQAWPNNDLYQPRYREDRSYTPSYRDDRSYQPSYRDDRSYQPSRRDYGNYQPAYPQYAQPQYQPQYQQPYRQYDYSGIYTPYSGYGYDDGYTSGGRSSWVEPLIRSVIGTFFSTGIGDGYYDDYNYDQAYYDDADGYESQYSYSQPTYYTFGYPAASTYYEPAAYYGYDQYAYNELPSDAFGGALGYSDVQDIYSGGIAGELIQRALGTGYYQGLLEGQLARKRGWGDRYYSDPYLYEQAIYDPYSSSMGNCRRYFSEGYEMGYDDALQGRDDFDLAGGVDVDLVSLLLGNVLSLRG
ncbi:MAG TPA: hypothetical protein VMZ26_04645 [Pyrinomonadaceae bacterium]|nr:hypothetical protein [Pyrinomonadaceae bacterium]